MCVRRVENLLLSLLGGHVPTCLNPSLVEGVASFFFFLGGNFERGAVSDHASFDPTVEAHVREVLELHRYYPLQPECRLPPPTDSHQCLSLLENEGASASNMESISLSLIITSRVIPK